jgi:hypothetical protein
MEKGEREMEENNMTKGIYVEAGYITLREEQLPALSASALHAAAAPDDIQFMADFMAKENVGLLHWFERLGFTLQNVGAGVLRCVYMVDHEIALQSLAMANETIVLAGGSLELAPHTVVRPFVADDQRNEVEASDDQLNAAHQEAPSHDSTVVGMEVA